MELQCASCDVCQVRGILQNIPPVLSVGQKEGRYLAIMNLATHSPSEPVSTMIESMCGFTTPEGVKWANFFAMTVHDQSHRILTTILDIFSGYLDQLTITHAVRCMMDPLTIDDAIDHCSIYTRHLVQDKEVILCGNFAAQQLFRNVAFTPGKAFKTRSGIFIFADFDSPEFASPSSIKTYSALVNAAIKETSGRGGD